MTEAANDRQTIELAAPSWEYRSRRLFRWLIGLFLLVVLIPLVIVGHRCYRQAELIELVDGKLGDVVTEPRGPEWLRNLVGEDRMRGFDRLRGIRLTQDPDLESLPQLARHRIPALIISFSNLTAEKLQPLKRMRSLRRLMIFGCVGVSDDVLRLIGELEGLEVLEIFDGEYRDESLAHLEDLTDLRYLGLYNRRVTGEGLSHLRDLDSLQVLILDDSGVTDRGLTHAQPLHRAEIETRATGRAGATPSRQRNTAPFYLRELDRLEALTLCETQVTGEGLEVLREMKGLKSLWLNHTPVDDDALQRLQTLSGLEVLCLEHTAITDEGLKHLHGLKQLQYLSAYGTALTDEGIKSFQRAVPGCHVETRTSAVGSLKEEALPYSHKMLY